MIIYYLVNFYSITRHKGVHDNYLWAGKLGGRLNVKASLQAALNFIQYLVTYKLDLVELANNRSDKYGWNIENPSHFVLKVMQDL